MEALRVGPGTDEANDIGPLINERAIVKVEEHLADARAQGARVLAGGGRLRGNFFEPTVVAGVTPAMRLLREETFGPVVPLASFTTEAEAVAFANATPFGLAAYFYSTDVSRIWRVAAAIESGMVAINDFALSSEVAPFGGVKDSGYGREELAPTYRHNKYLLTKNLSRGNPSGGARGQGGKAGWEPRPRRLATTSIGGLFRGVIRM